MRRRYFGGITRIAKRDRIYGKSLGNIGTVEPTMLVQKRMAQAKPQRLIRTKSSLPNVWISVWYSEFFTVNKFDSSTLQFSAYHTAVLYFWFSRVFLYGLMSKDPQFGSYHFALWCTFPVLQSASTLHVCLFSRRRTFGSVTYTVFVNRNSLTTPFPKASLLLCVFVQA